MGALYLKKEMEYQRPMSYVEELYRRALYSTVK